jgi:hypothetical protein
MVHPGLLRFIARSPGTLLFPYGLYPLFGLADCGEHTSQRPDPLVSR